MEGEETKKNDDDKEKNEKKEMDKRKGSERKKEEKGRKEEGRKYFFFGRRKFSHLKGRFQKNHKYIALNIFNNIKCNSINYLQWTKAVLLYNF